MRSIGSGGSRGLLGVVAVLAVVAASCGYVHPPFLAEVDAPVVLTGADVPDAIGLDPGRVIGYRWNDGWHQIPVQVDERVEVPFGSQPANNGAPGVDGTVYGNGVATVTALQYADPGTFVGPDTDPLIDADDEVVFMARDAGKRVPAGTERPPAAIVQGREVELVNHVDSRGYVYLFLGRADADPSAGVDYVDYDFDLVSGDYKDTYRRADGPNPETSTAVGETYEIDMVDRWKTVGLRVAGSDVDVLDGLKARFSFDTCGRSNATFAEAEGAFVANIDGPVRSIRSYVGANSGPLTQETLYFYANRIDVVTDLRVHAIGGIMSFMDLSAAASGMEYGNSEMGGETVTIDGVPDDVPVAVPDWHYAAGSQGLITWVDTFEVLPPGVDDIDLVWTDDADPDFQECWGEDGLHGAAAVVVDEPIPNTDPRSATFDRFRTKRVFGLWPASMSGSAWAPAWAATVHTPVTFDVAPGP